MQRTHWIIIGLIAAASFVVEFVLLADHPKKHWWSHVPAFYSLLGFVGCAVIIFVSKRLGAWFIQQKEDYYDAV